VSGEVLSAAPLEVRVALHNPGPGDVGPLDVVGELGVERRQARVVSGVRSGGTAAVVLTFVGRPARPGLHPLLLLLEHPVDGEPDAAGSPPVASQRAFLLLALGARPDPAVSLQAEPCVVDVRGALRVRLESRDGDPHRVSLEARPARGLRFEGGAVEVAVPASGPATAALPLFRAGAGRGSRHEVLVVAETLDGPLARATVASARVDVAPDRSLLPRLHRPLLALGILLLALAAVAQIRTRRRREG
jgi:hypothetical protein